eukprot:COSAG06_NODE_41753_length_388_cov_0.719723_1_plen_53_part_10
MDVVQTRCRVTSARALVCRLWHRRRCKQQLCVLQVGTHCRSSLSLRLEVPNDG